MVDAVVPDDDVLFAGGRRPANRKQELSVEGDFQKAKHLIGMEWGGGGNFRKNPRKNAATFD